MFKVLLFLLFLNSAVPCSAAFSFLWKVVSDNQTALVCNTVSQIIAHETENIVLEKQNEGLRSKNLELSNAVKILYENTEKQVESQKRLVTVMENSLATIDRLENQLKKIDLEAKEAFQAKEAIDRLGVAQLHMLSAFEGSENRAGFFTDKFKIALAKTNNNNRNSFDINNSSGTL